VPWLAPQDPLDRVVCWLATNLQRRWGKVAWIALGLRGTDIDPHVKFGRGLHVKHALNGATINGSTRIGDHVTIYQHVTVGRSDMWQPRQPGYVGVEIGDHAILCAGAVILTATHLRVGEGTIIGANSVLTRSTGDWEIWAGSPARKVGERPRG
jgi:serine acetyltransferase